LVFLEIVVSIPILLVDLISYTDQIWDCNVWQ
jgi:hypothetical protein